ncbi:hypothetical protein V496_03789 [Pseudogymnoascus sp. VKM F-4515 (FW-2607)]|nr:hypothetical protein V496_03789 [Pseudogymnoascus sp. VKM F-4515 (FW-2607)]KFY82385.1 hypothetical protein V498_08604 [Pseudogymnoascus sp. VKM F-4517 (FW-2822)]
MSTPHPITQPANSSPPSLTHQGLPNGIGPLTNHVHPTSSTVTITPSHLPSFGTTSTTPQTPAPLRRPSSSTPTIDRAAAPTTSRPGWDTNCGFFCDKTWQLKLDDPTATYMRELIEDVEAARVGGEGLRGGGRGDSLSVTEAAVTRKIGDSSAAGDGGMSDDNRIVDNSGAAGGDKNSVV